MLALPKIFMNHLGLLESVEEHYFMSSNAIASLVKMMEFLPENLQGQVVEHLREYLDELRSEQEWDETFKKTQNKLIAAAQLARKQIEEGQAQPMDYDQL
jgi:hypothetical protein